MRSSLQCIGTNGFGKRLGCFVCPVWVSQSADVVSALVRQPQVYGLCHQHRACPAHPANTALVWTFAVNSSGSAVEAFDASS